MAEALSEGEVSSTSNMSKDFLRIRYCKVVYMHAHVLWNEKCFGRLD